MNHPHPPFYAFLLIKLCQYAPLLNSYRLIFSLRPFGWLHSVRLTPVSSIISYGNNIFDLSKHHIISLAQQYIFRKCYMLRIK